MSHTYTNFRKLQVVVKNDSFERISRKNFFYSRERNPASRNMLFAHGFLMSGVSLPTCGERGISAWCRPALAARSAPRRHRPLARAHHFEEIEIARRRTWLGIGVHPDLLKHPDRGGIFKMSRREQSSTVSVKEPFDQRAGDFG